MNIIRSFFAKNRHRTVPCSIAVIVPFHYMNPMTGKPLTMESDCSSEIADN